LAGGRVPTFTIVAAEALVAKLAIPNALNTATLSRNFFGLIAEPFSSGHAITA